MKEDAEAQGKGGGNTAEVMLLVLCLGWAGEGHCACVLDMNSRVDKNSREKQRSLSPGSLSYLKDCHCGVAASSSYSTWQKRLCIPKGAECK